MVVLSMSNENSRDCTHLLKMNTLTDNNHKNKTDASNHNLNTFYNLRAINSKINIMKCFIELWKEKESWRKLSQQERSNYVNQLGPHIQTLIAGGVEIVCWGANEKSTDQRADYDFFAVWKFPNQEMVNQFEKLVEGSGWYNYFVQVNLSGDASSPNEILGQLINM